MSKKNTQSSKQKKSGAPATGKDPVTAIQQVARTMPAAVRPTPAEISDMRSAERRAPAKLIALVLSAAEEGDGSVAGIAIDATASRTALAQATRLRVGAAAARAVARQLEQQALTLASGVAQRALSATMSLESLARTPEGKSLAAQAAQLRTAARGTKKPSAKAEATASAAAAPSAAGHSPAATGASTSATPAAGATSGASAG